MTKAKVAEAKQALMERGIKQEYKEEDYLHTGSTMLNLALTGKADQGFLKGKFYFVIGDSSAGKTFFSLTCLAEAAINPSFDNYRFVFDDVEGGALMDFEKFFGPKAAARLEPPEMDSDGVPVYSDHIEDFYCHLDDTLKGDSPCIYLLDSMDGLSSNYEEKKFLEKKDAREKGKTAKGDYGDGKAKVNSSNIRSCMADLRDTKSILIVVNQTRDNINAGLFESKKTRSGGRALTFYATAELWLSIKRTIKKNVLGKDRVLGVEVEIHVKKNRISGKDRKVLVPIYYSTGIDDIGSCVNFLVTEGFWKKSGQTVKAPEFDMDATKDKLISHIEENNLEDKLKEVTAAAWNTIEEKCVVQRKSKYS